jgi:hypothetical protein
MRRRKRRRRRRRRITYICVNYGRFVLRRRDDFAPSDGSAIVRKGGSRRG